MTRKIKPQSEYLRFILFCGVILTLSLLVGLKSSGALIDLFWQKPSRFSGRDLRFWPPNLNFQIPNPRADSSTKKVLYLQTDQLGSLVEGHNKKRLLWIFGDSGAADLWTRPQERWTSLIKIPNSNFSIPKFNFNHIEELLEHLFSQSNVKPRWIVLGTGFLEHSHGFRIPDLSPFWIWGKPATTHSLFEFFCFFWSSSQCKSPQPTEKDFSPTRPWPEKIQASQIRKSTDTYFRGLAKLKKNLKYSDIILIGLIFPFEPKRKEYSREMISLLREGYSSHFIPFLDVERCFENNSDGDYFLDSGRRLSLVGNRLFSKCFEEEFRVYLDET